MFMDIARLRPAGAPDPDIDTVTPAVVIGLTAATCAAGIVAPNATSR
jgi:hypothetical protein